MKIDLDLIFRGGPEALAQMAKVDAATDAMKKKMNMMAPYLEFKKLEKEIANAEKTMTKFGDSAQSSGAKAAGGIMKAVVAAGALLGVVNLISKGFNKVISLGSDFAKDSYTKAVELNEERAGLRAEYDSEHKPGDKLINSMDNLAKTLLYLGIDMKDTFKTAKLYEMIFPKSNQVASENFVTTAALIARTKMHGNMEQASSALLQVESGIALGRFGVRLLKQIGLNEAAAQSLVKEIKDERKGKGGHRTFDEKINALEKGLHDMMAPMAKQMQLADPMAYFEARMKETSNILGQSLIKTLQTPGMQEMMKGLMDRFQKFIEGITPEKIEGTIEKLMSAFTNLSYAVMSIVEFIGRHLGKSNYQIKDENESLSKFFGSTPENKSIFDKYMAKFKGGMFDPKPTWQGILDMKERIENGKSTLDPKITGKEEIDFFHLLSKWKPSIFKLPKGNVTEPTVPDYKGGGKRGIENHNPFDIANETSRVTGNRPITININIQDQIKELNITTATLPQATAQIEDEIIRALDDALMSAQGAAMSR